MLNIDRRKFIGKTALAGISLAGASALISACKRQPDAKPIPARAVFPMNFRLSILSIADNFKFH